MDFYLHHLFYIWITLFLGTIACSVLLHYSEQRSAHIEKLQGLFFVGFFITILPAFGRFISRPDFSRPAGWIMSLLLVIGGGGFYASLLAAVGPIRLPNSWEWPAGFVRGVIRTADGKFVVPIRPVGRIQIYDPQWRFLRGWNIEALGGPFKFACTPNGTIDVFSLRGMRHYSFTQEGLLLSTDKFELPLPPLPKGQWMMVPTSPLLLIFFHPAVLLFLAGIGFWGPSTPGRITH
jgi:hypothetical protein